MHEAQIMLIFETLKYIASDAISLLCSRQECTFFFKEINNPITAGLSDLERHEEYELPKQKYKI